MPFVKGYNMGLKHKPKGFKGSELIPGVKRKRPYKKKNYFNFEKQPKKLTKQTKEERDAKREKIRKEREKALKEFEKWWK